MNSVRHVLSTTAQFRKVRIEGKSHWAILDEDLECFIDGEYKKPSSLGGAGEKVAAHETKEETPAPLPECKAVSRSPAGESSKPSYNDTTRRHPPLPREKSTQKHQLMIPLAHEFGLGLRINNIPFDSNSDALWEHNDNAIPREEAIHWGADDLAPDGERSICTSSVS